MLRRLFEDAFWQETGRMNIPFSPPDISEREINEVIDKALATDNSDEKIKYCNEIIDKWDNYFRKVTLVTDHSIVQSADISFGTLSALAEEESESIDETLIESKSELKQIYDSSRINLSNIF